MYFESQSDNCSYFKFKRKEYLFNGKRDTLLMLVLLGVEFTCLTQTVQVVRLKLF